MLPTDRASNPVSYLKNVARDHTHATNITMAGISVLCFFASKSMGDLNPPLALAFRLTSYVIAVKPIIAFFKYLGGSDTYTKVYNGYPYQGYPFPVDVSDKKPDPFPQFPPTGPGSYHQQRSSAATVVYNQQGTYPTPSVDTYTPTPCASSYQQPPPSSDDRMNRLDSNGESTTTWQMKNE